MNNIQTVLDYFSQYGYFFLALVVFLEYLNLPGLPAGIIMPAAGIIVKANGMNFTYTLILSVISGLLGSFVLYAIGYYIGKPAIDKLQTKFVKTKKAIDVTYNYVNKYGEKGVLISRVIPVARTLISLVAGVFELNFIKFTIYSIIGITIWNFGFIFAGYAFGHLFMK